MGLLSEGDVRLRILFINNLSDGDVISSDVYERHGFHADIFRHSGSSDAVLKSVPYGAVIYMTETPDYPVLKRWRKNGISIPVVVISRPSAVSVRVAFLNAGADDWLSAPASPEEVIARLRAVFRRSHALTDVVLRHEDVIFDPATRTATYRGIPVKLTAREMTILELLLLHHPRVLTRRYLEDQLCTWHRDICSNLIEVHVSNLRRKLDRDIIQTVRGQGYCLRKAGQE